MLDAPPHSKMTVQLDGAPHEVTSGTTVAALLAGRLTTGSSISTWCAMGVCQGCRVTIDSERGQRACLRLCTAGMEIRTDDA